MSDEPESSSATHDLRILSSGTGYVPMVCRYCGTQQTWRNQMEQCLYRASTWLNLWPRHQWMKQTVDATTTDVYPAYE